MKKLIFLFILLAATLTAQQTETRQVAKSINNANIITMGIPLVKSMEIDSSKLLDAGDYEIGVATPTYSSAAVPDPTWLNMVRCIIASQDIPCDSIGCGQPDEIEAGTWKVVAAIGRRNGLYTYWIQGQSEPLLNYHNGIVVFNGFRVQIWQQIGSDKVLTIGQELKFMVK